MKILLPVTTLDLHLFESTISVMEHLGGLEGFDLVIVPSEQVLDQAESYVDRLRLISRSCELLSVNYNEMGVWPKGPNQHWALTMYKLDAMDNRDFMFWMEPDCPPRTRGWAQAISDAHGIGGKRFSGTIVPTPHRNAAGQIVHHPYKAEYGNEDWMMMGCAVYPAGMTKNPEFGAIVRGLVTGDCNDPFDVQIRGFCLKHGWHATHLVGDRWNTGNYRFEDGKLVCDALETPFKNRAHDKTDISGAVVVHGVKDDSFAKLVLSGAFDAAPVPQSLPSVTLSSSAPQPPAAPAQDPLEALAGRKVTTEERENFSYYLDCILRGDVFQKEEEEPQPEKTTPPEIQPASADMLGKIESILSSGNIRLGKLASIIGTEKNDLKSLLEANGYIVTPISLWVKKAA